MVVTLTLSPGSGPAGLRRRSPPRRCPPAGPRGQSLLRPVPPARHRRGRPGRIQQGHLRPVSRRSGLLRLPGHDPPQEQLPDLVEEWRQTDRASWSVLPGTDPRSASYRTGPIFRGLSYDGEGGYWTQMYFFRDEGGPREGTERSIGYRRHPSTSSAGRTAPGRSRPCRQHPGCWMSWRTPSILLPQTTSPSPAQEPPVFTWRGEADGVKLELWPEAELRVQSAYIEGYEVKDLHLNEFGASIHTDAPDLDAQFTSVEGIMRICLTNTTGTHKSLTLNVTQNWGERAALPWMGPLPRKAPAPAFCPACSGDSLGTATIPDMM